MECVKTEEVDHSDRTLIDIVQSQAEKYGDRPLYSFLNRELDIKESMSFSGLLSSAKNVAARLQGMFKAGDVLLLCYPFGLDFVIAFWASILAGCTPIPLSRPRANDWRRVLQIAQSCHAQGVLSSSKMGGLSASFWEEPLDLRLVLTDEKQEAGKRWTKPEIGAYDCAFIQFTSGSTSAPKGVCVSHHNIVSNLEAIRKGFRLSDQDTTVSWLPFHHDMGLVGHLLEPLYSGMHNYFLAPMDFLACPSRWLGAISKYRGTVSGAPNFAFDMCAEKTSSQQIASLDLSSWRLAYCGSEPVSALVAGKFFDRFASAKFSRAAFTPCYGMAESTLYVGSKSGLLESVSSKSDVPYVCLGAGQDCDIRIVNQDTLSQCEAGDIGEVWLRSRSVAARYASDRLHTQNLADSTLGTDKGFLRTGDLGFMQSGELYITGRAKNTIKRRGLSIHCEDIERTVSHIFLGELFDRCAVVEVVAASCPLVYLILQSSRKSTNLSDRDDFEKLLRERVLNEHGLNIDTIVYVRNGRLPLTSSGKTRREVCKHKIRVGEWIAGVVNG